VYKNKTHVGLQCQKKTKKKKKISTAEDQPVYLFIYVFTSKTIQKRLENLLDIEQV
jgi:hypothetical protein